MAITENRKITFIVNIIYYLFIAVLVFLVVKYLLVYLMPFIIGFVLAAAVVPFSRRLCRRIPVSEKTAAVFSLLLLVGTIALAVFGIFHLLSCKFSDITLFLGSLIETIKNAASSLNSRLTPVISGFESATGINVNFSSDSFSQEILRFAKLDELLVGFVQSLFSSLPCLFLDTVVTVVSGCFIAADYDSIISFIISLSPDRHKKNARHMKNFLFGKLLKLLRAYLTLMLITFAELSLGLAVIGIKNPFGIAAVIAIVDIFPVLGTGTVLIPWAIIEILLGKTLLGVCLIILYVVITVVRNILEPKIVGGNIGLHPLVTLAAIILGLKTMGLLGVITFPIAVLVIKDLAENGIINLPFLQKKES